MVYSSRSCVGVWMAGPRGTFNTLPWLYAPLRTDAHFLTMSTTASTCTRLRRRCLYWRALLAVSSLVFLLATYIFTPTKYMQENPSGAADAADGYARYRGGGAGAACKPVNNVYYAKQHKTGSSTFLTVLYKYMRTHGLTMYPVTDTPFPSTMSKYFFRPPVGRAAEEAVYNMFGEHATFAEESVPPIMPNGTHYVVSLRHPMTQLRSMMAEFGWAEKLRFPKHEDPVGHFLQNVYQYSVMHHFAQNPMSRMLGYVSSGEGVRQADVERFTERAARRFSHVILVEHFDESMVLLKRELCWEFSDIVYVKLRSREYMSKGSALEHPLVDMHKSISQVDYPLYDMFRNATLRKISQEKDLMDEVTVYRRVLNDVAMFCSDVMDRIKNKPNDIINVLKERYRRKFDPRPWGNAFELSAKDCAIMNLRTRIHRKMLLLRQFPELCSGDFDILYPVGQFASSQRNVFNALVGPIEWRDNNTLIFSPEFCEQWDDETGFSLTIMCKIEAFMIVGPLDSHTSGDGDGKVYSFEKQVH